MLGVRVKGGLQAKRKAGGFCGRAPDGYRNVSSHTSPDMKKDFGRIDHWIEQDPERAAIWRYAWDLLLEDRMTLDEIAESLHAQGYMRSSGRPWVEITSNGKRRPNVSTLSSTFHNWAYAGWIVSKQNNIPPKTLRGSWEPIVSTEEFERGLAILARRMEFRVSKKRHDYLLKGLVYYAFPDRERPVKKLICSTPNASRKGGGTAYYCIEGTRVSFMCSLIDGQISRELLKIQVDPELIPIIRECYSRDLNEHLSYLQPDEYTRLEVSLKTVDEEEVRAARLFASGKISEDIWDKLWAEWHDRRQSIRSAMDSMKHQKATHVTNLETALQIIAKVGLLYNGLERSNQKELLRQMVERVIVNPEGMIHLELRTPFAYLKNLTDKIRGDVVMRQTKTRYSAGSGTQCSGCIHQCWEGRTYSEHPESSSLSNHLAATPQNTQFPHRAKLLSFIPAKRAI